MSKHKDILAIITMILIVVTSVAGILSLNFNRAFEFVNQYGHTVQIYGYGIYANDSYFQAPISIGTDICILFVVFPMFLYTYIHYMKRRDKVSELKLVTVYAVVFYYAASIVFGLTYNRLFLVYVALFSCSLFGMFCHIKNVEWNQEREASKGLKVFFCVSGMALIVAWLPDVIPTVINGTTLSLIGVYTTNITYVLDMGIISPLCFVCVFLLGKKNSTGVLLQGILLKLCMVVGIMMIPQTICQMASGCELPLPALITKSFSFILLGGYAFYFNRKMYRDLAGDTSYTIREMRETEYSLLNDFLYEAIFVPEGVDAPPKSIINNPELQLYVSNFGNQKHDFALVAEMDQKIIGAVWVRIMNDYGHVDEKTPSFAISLYKEYRGKGIGTAMMKRMLADLRKKGYEQTSLAVQKDNYAVKMYQDVGFEIVDENEEEYIMVKHLR